MFQKKQFKKRFTQYFSAENKSPCCLVELSKQSLLPLNMSKNMKENLTNVRLCGLQYLGDMSYFTYTKTIRIPRAKST